VQLALEDEVFLFHFKWRPLGPDLLSILENPAVIKTGVAVHDDMRFLNAVRPFRPASVIDLGEVARLNNVENRGLRGLAALFLGLRISKTEHCSNWGHGDLSPRQISYAATDAWISRALYLKMHESGLDFSGEANRKEQAPSNDSERGRRFKARRIVHISLSGGAPPRTPRSRPEQAQGR
jgi:ribonuclease D